MLRQLCLDTFAPQGSTLLQPYEQTLVLLQAQRFDADLIRRYPKLVRLTICASGDPVGRLLLDSQDSRVRVLDLALLPEMRGQGIGTHLIKELVSEASGSGISLHAEVRKDSRALGLFERLGFTRMSDLGDAWALAVR
jgi:ribosomal protein S18 acetylase RimI-like enzyme